MFKIGLENRDFCKSLHFYIVDAGKKKKKKKKKRAASAGLFSCSRPFGPRTSPFGRCPHYLFFLCCGALASALIVDAEKKKKKKKKKKTSCICWLVQLLSALRAEDIALRAMPSLFVFLVLRGACQRLDHSNLS